MGVDNIVTDLSIIMWITQNMKNFCDYVDKWVQSIHNAIHRRQITRYLRSSSFFTNPHALLLLLLTLYPTIKNSNSKEYRNLIYIIQLKIIFYLRLSQKYRYDVSNSINKLRKV